MTIKTIKSLIYLFFFIIFFSFVFHISSFIFFHHSFATYPFICFVFFLFYYHLRSEQLEFSYLSLFLFFFLIYAFFVTLNGYYKPDGLFLVYFLFVLYITYIFIENVAKNRMIKQIIVDAIFLLSFLDVLYSYFEFILKSIGIFDRLMVPYFIFVTHSSSIGGFLYQSNLNALLINLGLIITIFKIIRSNEVKEKLYFFIIYLFFSIGASFTSSRASLIAILGVFFYIFIHKRFFQLNLTKQQKRMFISLFTIYIFIFMFNRYSPFAKFISQGLISDNSVDARLMIWLSAILLWMKHPFFGTGVETFKFLNNPYQIKACHILRFPSDIIGNFTWAHNEPIQILEELGIVAFLSIIAITIAYYIKVIKKENNPYNLLLPSLLIVYFIQGGLSWPLRYPALLSLFFVILALVDKHTFFVLKGMYKNIAVFFLFFLFLFSTIYMIPHIKNDIYYTLKVSKAKNIDQKINLLYNAQKDPYLFWIASAGFLSESIPYYLRETTGMARLPFIKSDVKMIKIDKKKRVKLNKLRKEILVNAKNMERLHKMWTTEYYLGLAYMFDDDLENSKFYAKKAIEDNPNPQYLWSLLHYINVLNASRKTGKPIKDFLPTKKEVENLFKSMKKTEQTLK